MDDEKKAVVAEKKEATKKKEHLFKNPKFLKITKYVIYVAGTIGVGTVAYFIGKKNGGASVALPEVGTEQPATIVE